MTILNIIVYLLLSILGMGLIFLGAVIVAILGIEEEEEYVWID